MKVMVIYDSSPDAKTALAYGLTKVKASGGELITYYPFRRKIFQNKERKLYSNEETLENALEQSETVTTLVDRKGRKVRTTMVFAVIKNPSDILRYAARAEADLIVATPEFDILFEKACCLVDIVSAGRGNFGIYKKLNQEARPKMDVARTPDGPGCSKELKPAECAHRIFVGNK